MSGGNCFFLLFSLHGNGDTIRIGREIQCLLYAGFSSTGLGLPLRDNKPFGVNKFVLEDLFWSSVVTEVENNLRYISKLS